MGLNCHAARGRGEVINLTLPQGKLKDKPPVPTLQGSSEGWYMV
jgi:hypothetical protein